MQKTALLPLCISLILSAWVFTAPAADKPSLCRPGEIAEAKNWKIWSELLGEHRDPRLKVTKTCILEPDHEYSAYDGYILDVFIGRIKTEAAFNRMKAYFGGLSKVPFSPEKDYNLIDFLPPAMQAMVNKVFLPDHYPHLSEKMSELKYGEESDIDTDALHMVFKNGVGSSSNCWNTTIENIRLMFGGDKSGLGEYHLYWPGRWEVSEYINDPIPETSAPNPISRVLRPEQIRFGDVLVVYQTGFADTKSLQHTSLVLTPDLVFEKIDSSAEHAYRIALRDDSPTKIKDILKDDAREYTVGVEYRRVNPEIAFPPPDRLKLEDPEVLPKKTYDRLPQEIKDLFLTMGCETGLGGGCDTQTTAVAKVRIGIDGKTGRGTLIPIVQSKRYFGGTEVLDRFKPVVRY